VVGAGAVYLANPSRSATTTMTTTQYVSNTQYSPKEVNGSMDLAVNQNSSLALVNGAWDGGYLWQVTNVSNPSVVESVSNYTYVPPHNATLVGGPADTQIFTFKALKEGNSSVTLELVRSWQLNESISRYVLYVVVGP
jgi:predicted secreted protein